MSYLLGIYSKTDKLDRVNFKPVVNYFKKHALGKFKYFSDDRVFLSKIHNPDDSISKISENEDGTKIIFFTGELYGLYTHEIELLKKRGHRFRNENDQSELMLHMYEEFGDTNYKNLNGSYSFAIYDKQNGNLAVGNDSFGSYPLFVSDSKEIIIFCTEYEPITRYRKFEKSLDLDSVAEYFSLGQTMGDKTLFKNIKNLSPGSVMIVSNSTVWSRKFDNLDIRINRQSSIESFAKELSVIVRNAVQQRLNDRLNLKCSLTGGTDSRLILCNLTKKQRESLEFVTTNNPWITDDINRDVVISRMLATKYNLKHRVISKKDDVYTDYGLRYIKSKLVKNTKGRNRIMGWGGGEFIGGACLDSQLDIINTSPQTVDDIINNFFHPDFVKSIAHPLENLEVEINKISAENRELLFGIFLYTRPFFSYRWRGSRAGWLQPYKFILQGIPVLWDDNNIFKFLLTVPAEYLRDRKLFRALYYNHYSEFLDIPTTRQDMNPIDLPLIPYSKIKFKYSRALRAYLNSHYTFDKNIYNSDYLRSISGDTRNELIIRFIDFEAWYRMYAL